MLIFAQFSADFVPLLVLIEESHLKSFIFQILEGKNISSTISFMFWGDIMSINERTEISTSKSSGRILRKVSYKNNDNPAGTHILHDY